MQRRVNWPDIKPSGYSANLEAGYCRFDKITDTYPAIFFGKGNNCLALTGTNFSFGLSRIRPFLAIVCKYLLSTSYRYIFCRKSVFFLNPEYPLPQIQYPAGYRTQKDWIFLVFLNIIGGWEILIPWLGSVGDMPRNVPHSTRHTVTRRVRQRWHSTPGRAAPSSPRI